MTLKRTFFLTLLTLIFAAAGARADTVHAGKGYFRLGVESSFMDVDIGPAIALGTVITPDWNPQRGRWFVEYGFARHRTNNGSGSLTAHSLAAFLMFNRPAQDIIRHSYYFGIGAKYLMQTLGRGMGHANRLAGLLRVGIPWKRDIYLDLDYTFAGRIHRWNDARSGGVNFSVRFSLP